MLRSMNQTEPTTDNRQRAEGARWKIGWYVVPWQSSFGMSTPLACQQCVYLTY